MENLKIQIKIENNENLKEAHDLLLKFGFSTYNEESFDVWVDQKKPIWLKTNCFDDQPGKIDWSTCDSYDSFKETTLPQLRDLVVLKRNDVGDATHIRGDGKKYFHAKSTDYFYQFSNDGEWLLSTWMNYQLLPQLKPIKNPMKEYLNPNQNYKLVLCAEKDKGEGFIEVPDGAECAMLNSDCSLNFFKNINGELHYYNDATDGNWFKSFFGIDSSVVWQRHTQPEELPFIDDEPSLNDQYAEIEKVRQSKIDETLAERQAQYGCFEDVAFTTESIMGILSKVRSNGLQDLPHTHRMALYMIASKMARIVNGDFNSIDGWHDIGGYARLIEKLIKGE